MSNLDDIVDLTIEDEGASNVEPPIIEAPSPARLSLLVQRRGQFPTNL